MKNKRKFGCVVPAVAFVLFLLGIVIGLWPLFSEPQEQASVPSYASVNAEQKTTASVEKISCTHCSVMFVVTDVYSNPLDGTAIVEAFVTPEFLEQILNLEAIPTEGESKFTEYQFQKSAVPDLLIKFEDLAGIVPKEDADALKHALNYVGASQDILYVNVLNNVSKTATYLFNNHDKAFSMQPTGELQQGFAHVQIDGSLVHTEDQ